MFPLRGERSPCNLGNAVTHAQRREAGEHLLGLPAEPGKLNGTLSCVSF